MNQRSTPARTSRKRLALLALLLLYSIILIPSARAHPPPGGGGSGAYYNLTVVPSGTGAGYVTGRGIDCGTLCEARFESGTRVVLEASPSSGSYFAGWGSTDCPNAESICTMVMTSDHLVSPAFELPTPKTVSLTVSRTKVPRGRNVTFRATVSPCSGHGGDLVELRSLGATLRSGPTNAACTAAFSLKMSRTRSFYAVSPVQDADHSSGISPDLVVRVKRP